MSSRTIAIGDIHGCSQALETLLKAIKPQADDVIITLGDYVDRGHDSKGVVERLVLLAKQCKLIPLLGNHEIMMLGALEDEIDLDFWLNCGGQATVDSYDGSLELIPESHLQFLGQLKPFHETESHFFVHANYLFDQPLDDQPEAIRYWEHIGASVPPPHQNGKVAVVGHTPQTDGSIRDVGHLILLDTFCFGGMWLSAIDFTNGVVWQADDEGQIFEEQIPDSSR